MAFVSLFLFGTYLNSDRNNFPWINEHEKINTSNTWFSNGIRIESNWQEVCDSNEWCHKENDTYIIENMVIDAENSRKGIYIEDTIEPFIIRNCHIYRSQKFRDSGGIHLLNVQNGFIINNNCSNNLGNGISIFGGGNIIISNNTLNNNGYSGIATFSASELEISDNIIRNNQKFGIYHESFASVLERNQIEFNSRSGIQLFYGEDNDVSENTVINCTEHGITLFESNNNIIQKNEVINNTIYGIFLEISNTNTIKNNIIDHVEGCIRERECNGNVFESNICNPDTGLQIPGYNLLILIGVISFICIFLIYKNKNRIIS